MSWSGFNRQQNPGGNAMPASFPPWAWFWGADDSEHPHDVGVGVDRAAPASQFPPGFPFAGAGGPPFGGPWAQPWGRPGHGRGHGWGHRGRRGSCRGRRHGGRRGSPPPGDEQQQQQPAAEDAPPYRDADGAGVTADEKTALLADEKEGSPATMRDAPAEDPPELAPADDQDDDECAAHFHTHRGPGPCGGGGWGGRRGGRGGFFAHGPHGHHTHHGHHGQHGHPGHHGPMPPWMPPFAYGPAGPDAAGPGTAGPPPPPPYVGNGAPFNFRDMMRAFANHPLAEQMRACAEHTREAVARARGSYSGNAAAGANNNNNNEAGDDEDVLVPPVDVFDTGANWTVHVALPGAKKEDVGLHWDAERSELAVSGVVHRPGDEEFLRGLVSGERRIGLFRRSVRIPPAKTAGQQQQQPPQQQDGEDETGEKHEEMMVDEEGITARMEDGVLIIVVPKLEKEWTQVRKVDIE